MSLPVPTLDDRQFTALVAQAVRQIPRYTPAPDGWTDHNAHDPGITLLELFAWLAEMQIYRLDRVPALHKQKFLRLLGVTPHPARPARAYVTFTPLQQGESITLPAGTQVAAAQTGTQELIVFETDVALQVLPVTLVQVITSDRLGIHDHTPTNEQEGAFFFAFGDSAEAGSSLYIGLDSLTSPPEAVFLTSPLERLQLTLMVSLYEQDLPARGVHGDERLAQGPDSVPHNAPAEVALPFFPSGLLVWEYWNGGQWAATWPDGTPLLSQDATAAFSWSGTCTFNLPPDLARRSLAPFRTSLYWLRCRVIQAHYEISPRCASLRLHTVSATQGVTAVHETLGSSNALPHQRFKFAHAPVLAGTPQIAVVEADGRSSPIWQEVLDFDASGPDDTHYVLHEESGEVQFGDGINGRIPPPGTDNIKAVTYRYGGGLLGNVAADTIRISYDSAASRVAVSNAQPATGGAVAEPWFDAWRRALLDLRTPYQAVTSADYEFLAQHTPGLRVARAKALPLIEPVHFTRRPGIVTVVVVPYSFVPNPLPSDGFLHTVCAHLDRHRLITTEVRVIPPDYVQVSVEATVLLKPYVAAVAVRQDIEAALRAFLHPLSGGVAGTGWEFGRSVYQSEIYQVIEGVHGVDCVMRVALAAQGHVQFEGHNIALTQPHGLVFSGAHQLELIDPAQQCNVKGPCHDPQR